ncbi:hypothetical protein M3Y99_00756700 [Aphelenchoides fujianensis]|nr:hypothetical protein M3Y99_00756700 [Aphelenchoides fujianensis]
MLTTRWLRLLSACVLLFVLMPEITAQFWGDPTWGWFGGPRPWWRRHWRRQWADGPAPWQGGGDWGQGQWQQGGGWGQGFQNGGQWDASRGGNGDRDQWGSSNRGDSNGGQWNDGQRGGTDQWRGRDNEGGRRGNGNSGWNRDSPRGSPRGDDRSEPLGPPQELNRSSPATPPRTAGHERKERRLFGMTAVFPSIFFVLTLALFVRLSEAIGMEGSPATPRWKLAADDASASTNYCPAQTVREGTYLAIAFCCLLIFLWVSLGVAFCVLEAYSKKATRKQRDTETVDATELTTENHHKSPARHKKRAEEAPQPPAAAPRPPPPVPPPPHYAYAYPYGSPVPVVGRPVPVQPPYPPAFYAQRPPANTVQPKSVPTVGGMDLKSTNPALAATPAAPVAENIEAPPDAPSPAPPGQEPAAPAPAPVAEPAAPIPAPALPAPAVVPPPVL